MDWKIHHKTETVSTNIDARVGVHGDVFTADYQTAGRGRLDHKWLSPPKTNLMMSAVLDVAGLDPEHVATLPLVVGLAVVNALSNLIVLHSSLITQHSSLSLKWPNDVLIGGRKVAGILCERKDDCVIAGIGVNVMRQDFSPEIAGRAIAVEEVLSRGTNAASPLSVGKVRDAVLSALAEAYLRWRVGGFAAVYPAIREIDFLRGQTLAVRQTDDDAEPVRGVCGGINADGSLDVGGVKIYAGEAHVEAFR